jgi:cysteinyl-tRNA synthetase
MDHFTAKEQHHHRSATRRCQADEIRDDLKDKGVLLTDEKGAHGDGLTVTSWRRKLCQ